MNLTNPQTQKAIIELAESSESKEVAEVCKLVIQDHLERGDTEIDGPREVILTALGCMETPQSYYDREREYLCSLKIGERVIETGNSMTTGWQGTVVQGSRGLCVKWDNKIEGGRLTTAITHGTRRISEVQNEQV